MVPRVRVLMHSPGNLDLISGIYMVEGENRLLRAFSDTHAYDMTNTSTCTQVRMHANTHKGFFNLVINSVFSKTIENFANLEKEMIILLTDV